MDFKNYICRGTIDDAALKKLKSNAKNFEHLKEATEATSKMLQFC